jgi:hypothetical protein
VSVATAVTSGTESFCIFPPTVETLPEASQQAAKDEQKASQGSNASKSVR